MKLKKVCKNSDCNQEITEYKSSKRQYCDETCKNRSHYLKRTLEESFLIEKDKAIRKNYKILTALRQKGLDNILFQTLESHGFDLGAAHKDEIKIGDYGRTVQLACVYDINFIIKDEILIFKN